MPTLTVIFRIISVYIFFPVFFFFSAILLSPVKFKMKHFNSYDGDKQAMFIHVSLSSRRKAIGSLLPLGF